MAVGKGRLQADDVPVEPAEQTAVRASSWSSRPAAAAGEENGAHADGLGTGDVPVVGGHHDGLLSGDRQSVKDEAVRLRELCERTLEMVRDGGGIYEYWNPLTGARARGATSGFGWSAALFMDLARVR